MRRSTIFLFLIGGLWLHVSLLGAQERLTFLYPSPGGQSWFIPVMTKEAKYFDREGLSVELVRVGGSTRIVAALIGGSGSSFTPGSRPSFPRWRAAVTP